MGWSYNVVGLFSLSIIVASAPHGSKQLFQNNFLMSTSKSKHPESPYPKNHNLKLYQSISKQINIHVNDRR